MSTKEKVFLISLGCAKNLVDSENILGLVMERGYSVVSDPEEAQVGIINTFSGFLWAGYNLSNFNLLLELTPDEGRPRAVALFQTAVFGSAVIGPLLGGFLADAIGFKFVFGLSSAGRYLGIALFILLTIRPGRTLERKS